MLTLIPATYGVLNEGKCFDKLGDNQMPYRARTSRNRGRRDAPRCKTEARQFWFTGLYTLSVLPRRVHIVCSAEAWTWKCIMIIVCWESILSDCAFVLHFGEQASYRWSFVKIWWVRSLGVRFFRRPLFVKLALMSILIGVLDEGGNVLANLATMKHSRLSPRLGKLIHFVRMVDSALHSENLIYFVRIKHCRPSPRLEKLI